jgi:hypothetical protein
MDDYQDGTSEEVETIYSPDWLIDSGCVDSSDYGSDYAPTADADSYSNDFGADPYIGEQYTD